MNPPMFQQLRNATLAYRVHGSGEPLLLLHGYPLNGLTFRHVVPLLAEHFTCYVPDMLGAGETDWSNTQDFSFKAQAETLKAFVDELGLQSYSVLAHNTGGTIARALALIDSPRVKQMALVGTEIPEHRPPWIEFFQRIANPKQTLVLQSLMKSKWFRESGAGFGGCFYDRRLIHGEFYEVMIAPSANSKARASGLTRYLLGIDWKFVDSLKEDHAFIKAPTLLIWGEEDTVFPVEEARAMVEQLGNCKGFVTVPRARLFVHEEHPEAVARIVRQFMVEGQRFDSSQRSDRLAQ